MGIGQASVAAATAVVGYDLLKDTWFQNIARNRYVTGFGLAGSAAALDTKVELFIDTVKIGDFYNSGTGLPNNDSILPLDKLFCPAGALVHVYITDAPVTNPINCILRWEE